MLLFLRRKNKTKQNRNATSERSTLLSSKESCWRQTQITGLSDHKTWFLTLNRGLKSPGEGIGYPLQYYPLQYCWASLVAQMAKNPPAMLETWVWSLCGEDPLRRAWQPIPVFLPGESLWTEEPSRLQSMGLQRVGHDWATKHNTAQGTENRNFLSFCFLFLPKSHPLGAYEDGRNHCCPSII